MKQNYIFSPDDLREGNLYQFTQSDNDRTNGRFVPKWKKSIIESSEVILRFEGIQSGLFTFREIKGHWTVSLSKHQLIGKHIWEVRP